ncbi:MAG TPA: hypothetical protein ENI73_01165 [Spirochaetes bacterium]|nr:hypothetical protein [Spirochaetota bacterium]
MKRRDFIKNTALTAGGLLLSGCIDRHELWDTLCEPIQPDAISGLKLWLKADAGITTATGVSNWADQSGNGNNATQGTGSSQPAFIASEPTLNNQAVVRFDGTNDFMTMPEFMNSSQPTLIIVGKSASGASQRFFHDYGGVLYDREITIWYRFGLGYEFAIKDTSLNWISQVNGSTLSYFIGTNIVIGTSINVYYNGAMLSASNAGYNTTTTWTTGPPPTLGKFSGSSTNYLNGDIAEIIIYNNPISNADRLGVESYLSKKYGISVPCQ